MAKKNKGESNTGATILIVCGIIAIIIIAACIFFPEQLFGLLK